MLRLRACPMPASVWHSAHSGDNARRILDERLARGEIDTEEYRRLRDVLASGEGRSPAGSGSGR
jgi:uncharacterized membrane protein